MRERIFMVAACAALLPLSACDDIGTSTANRSDAAPRGTFSSGVNGMSGGGAPERGELERLRSGQSQPAPGPTPDPTRRALRQCRAAMPPAERDLPNRHADGPPRCRALIFAVSFAEAKYAQVQGISVVAAKPMAAQPARLRRTTTTTDRPNRRGDARTSCRRA